MKKKNFSRLLKRFELTVICCFIYAAIFAQHQISGYVRDNDGNLPLNAASVVLKGSRTGTATDTAGFFTINAKKGAMLIVSYIGFNSREITIGNDSVLNIYLLKSLSSLDQVVVTGYTTQKVKEITGSVTVINYADLISVPDGQLEKVLQGKAAGLTVITSGQPGGSSYVHIDGIGNFGNVAPLYVIDGVAGDINSLNANDVESIQVLRDAGAYSIYGVRAANGVIIITTKKGKSGKTKLNFDMFTGVQDPLGKGPDLLDPQGQAALAWLSLRNSGQVDPATGNPVSSLYGNGPVPVLPDYVVNGYGYQAGNPAVNPSLYNITPTPTNPVYQILKFNKQGTDWFHELFRPAVIQNYAFNVSGGNEKNHYLVSLGYLDQQGTYINTYLKKITARVNSDLSVSKGLRFGENIQLSQSQSPPVIPDIYHALLTDPYLPVYDIAGNYSSERGPSAGPADNPVAVQRLTKDNRNNQWQAFGNIYGEVDLLKNLTFRSNFGGTLNFHDVTYFAYGQYDTSSGQGLNSFSETNGYSSAWTWTNTVSFSQRFKGDHSLKILAGTEAVSNYSRSQSGLSQGYLTDDPNLRLLGNGNGNPADQTIIGLAANSFLSSFISRADYGYKDRIFFTATLRKDGSSVFGAENRFGWFPSFSAAWRITEEDFMKKITWLSDLKLRASWGKSGFDGNTSPLNQYTLYGLGPGSTYYDIFGTGNSTVQGFSTLQYGNAKTGWQKDMMTNAGFDAVFWNGALCVSAEWYQKKSNGLLFKASLPALLGYATPPNVNVGEVDNTGVNITLGSKGKFAKDWRWNASLAFTTYHNKVAKLNDFPYLDDPGGIVPGGIVVRQEVGYPVGSFFGYKITGIFKSQTEVANSPAQDGKALGEFRYLDANGDGVISDADRVHFGNPNPKFTAGINLGFSYKNFDFSTFSYWSCGNDVMNIVRDQSDIYSGNPFPQNKAALYESWTPDRPNATVPIAAYAQGFSNNAVINSYGLEKGSYFRNKTMMLGYTLPASILRKLKTERLRIYMEVTNLFTITAYKGLDPELTGQNAVFGIDGGNYPNNQRQYLLGLNLTL